MGVVYTRLKNLRTNKKLSSRPVEYFNEESKNYIFHEFGLKSVLETKEVEVKPMPEPEPLIPEAKPIAPFSRSEMITQSLFTLPGQVSDESEIQKLIQDISPPVKMVSHHEVHISGDFKQEKNKLPPLEKHLIKSKPSKKRVRIALPPLEPSLFQAPGPVLQDIEDEDIKYGQYKNRCPSRGGFRFDLDFMEEGQTLAPKPVLYNQARARQNKRAMKKQLKKKQENAELRRKVNAEYHFS